MHFEPPYKHAKHYMGFTQDVDVRYDRHVAGRGSPLVSAALAAGCVVTIERVWSDVDRNFERQLKRRKAAPRMCPKCNEGVKDYEAPANARTSQAVAV